MEMTDNEIYRDWKEAKDPAKQVRILADMNRCKPAKIIAIISRMKAAEKQTVSAEEAPSKEAPAEAVPVEVEPVTAEPVPADDLDKRLVELYKSGATFKEMVAALSVPLGTVKYRVKKLTDSGELTNRVPRKKKTQELKPERTVNAPMTIPADDMMQWLEVLRTCVGKVESAKITHICANDGSQAEVKFTVGGKTYLISVEVRES